MLPYNNSLQPPNTGEKNSNTISVNNFCSMLWNVQNAISDFHVQCFAKNPWVREEKSNSFPDCEESDESEVEFGLPATGILGVLPLLGALFPIAYGLQHKKCKI